MEKEIEGGREYGMVNIQESGLGIKMLKSIWRACYLTQWKALMRTK